MAPHMEDQKTYELGYLLSPLVAAEAVAETVEKEIKKVLSTVKAQIKSEVVPKMRQLAYPIKKIVEHKGSTFAEAYFGAVVFVAEPSAVVEIEVKLKKSAVLIRHLLITLPPVALLAPTPRRAPGTGEAPVGEDGSAKMTEKAMDQEIDQLLTAK